MHHLGCWKDGNDRAIAGEIVKLKPPETLVQGCRMRTETMGWNVFAVQNDRECFTAADAVDTYQKHGEGTGCRNGRGGTWRIDVYEIRCFIAGTHKFTVDEFFI